MSERKAEMQVQMCSSRFSEMENVCVRTLVSYVVRTFVCLDSLVMGTWSKPGALFFLNKKKQT